MIKKYRILHPDFPINVGARCNNRENFPIPLQVVWEIFSDYLFLINKEFNIKIISFVLMSNHFHMICRDPDMKLSVAMQWLMRETSKEIGRKSGRVNRLWGGPFFSTILTDSNYFLYAYKYNYRNPVAARTCKNVQDYHWSTLSILLGQRAGIIPLELDETLLSDPVRSLDWLNTAYKEDEANALKKAFNKKVAKLVKDKRTNCLNPLLARNISKEITRWVPES